MDSDDFVSPAAFFEIGTGLCRRAPGLHTVVHARRFRSLFGASPSVCSQLWALLAATRPASSKPVHLLWAMMFLKIYGSEHVHASLASVDEKTLRKWIWIFVILISRLPLVRSVLLNQRRNLIQSLTILFSGIMGCAEGR